MIVPQYAVIFITDVKKILCQQFEIYWSNHIFIIKHVRKYQNYLKIHKCLNYNKFFLFNLDIKKFKVYESERTISVFNSHHLFIILILSVLHTFITEIRKA